MSKYEENGIEIDGLDEIEVENTAVDDLESESINLIFLGIDESEIGRASCRERVLVTV